MQHTQKTAVDDSAFGPVFVPTARKHLKYVFHRLDVIFSTKTHLLLRNRRTISLQKGHNTTSNEAFSLQPVVRTNYTLELRSSSGIFRFDLASGKCLDPPLSLPDTNFPFLIKSFAGHFLFLLIFIFQRAPLGEDSSRRREEIRYLTF